MQTTASFAHAIAFLPCPGVSHTGIHSTPGNRSKMTKGRAPLACCCLFPGAKDLQTWWWWSRTLYNHQWELCESHFSLTCEEHTARRYILWLYHYLSLLSLCEFDTAYEFSGNLADEIVRTKTFHCQEVDLSSTPNCGSFSRNLQGKQDTIRHFIRCCPDSEMNWNQTKHNLLHLALKTILQIPDIEPSFGFDSTTDWIDNNTMSGT